MVGFEEEDCLRGREHAIITLPFMERRCDYMLSKVKSIIIFVLSVILALESGAIVTYVSVMSALREKRIDRSRRTYGSRVSY